MRVGIIDYGAGNIASVRTALQIAGGEPYRVTTPEEVEAADRLVLPGVGAAGEAMLRLVNSGLDLALAETVQGKGRPLLGICLGLQLLAERLHEFGDRAGMGWVAGDVAWLGAIVGDRLRVPHMGWNQVAAIDENSALLGSVRGKREFYFSHSFALVPTDRSIVAGTTEYGSELVAAVRFGTVFATQFHPEKSQQDGIQLISAFLKWSP